MNKEIMIHWIPEEILCQIFRLLGFRDRLRSRQVCRKWKNVIEERRLLEDGFFSIGSETKLPSFFNGAYKCEGIRSVFLKNVNLLYEKYKIQWDALLPRLQCLSIQFCDVTSSNLVEILSRSINLKTLHLIQLRDLFLSGIVFNKEEDVIRLSKSLARIRDINLSDNRYMSDLIFSKIVCCSVELESLDVSGCNILNNACSATSVFTFPTIFKCIAGRCRELRRLNISSTTLDDKGIIELSEIPNLRLEELNISNCSGITSEGLLSLLRNQTDIKEINLDNCQRWISVAEDAMTLEIASRLSTIDRVSIAGLRIPNRSEDLAEKLFSEFAKGGAWKRINISGIQAPGCILINSFRKSKFASGLMHLEMSYLFTTSYKDIVSLLKPLKNLRVLIMTRCENVTDHVLDVIFKNLTKIEVLNLNGCVRLTDGGFGESIDSSKTHSVSNTPTQSEGAARAETENVCSIKNLQRLESLYISFSRITASSVLHFFAFKNLLRLDVSYCESLEDISFIAIGKQCPAIRVLIAKHCHLTDVGFIGCTKRLKNAEEIDVERCNNLTSLSISNLHANCKYLRRINICHCYKIDQFAVDSLKDAYFNINILCHAHSYSDLSYYASLERECITRKKSKKIKPWSLFCCVSKGVSS